MTRMLSSKYVSASSNKSGEITFLRVTVAFLLLIIMLEAGVLVKTLGMEKTVIVPPDIHRSFWVSGNEVSKSYLEQMAYWYAGLALNVTPAIGEYQKGLFLKYATPADAGRLESEMGARLAFLSRNSAATQFTAQSLNGDEKAMKVAITGNLITYVGDKKAGEKHTVYLVGFRYLNGRLHVSEFRETSEQDQFGIGAHQ